MDRDELKKGIMALLDEAEIIIKAPPEFYAMKSKVTLKIDGKAGIADDFLSLLAPELEKARLFILNKDYIDRFYSEAEELRTNAEKWRTLVRISKCNQIACIEGTCQYKKLCNPQMPLCGEARDLMLAIFEVNRTIVNAL